MASLKTFIVLAAVCAVTLAHPHFSNDNGAACQWSGAGWKPFALCSSDSDCANCESSSFTYAYCDKSQSANGKNLCHFNCDGQGVKLSHGGKCFNLKELASNATSDDAFVVTFMLKLHEESKVEFMEVLRKDLTDAGLVDKVEVLESVQRPNLFIVRQTLSAQEAKTEELPLEIALRPLEHALHRPMRKHIAKVIKL
eukprot:Colp12_sorted_trinity150504_noHs@26432